MASALSRRAALVLLAAGGSAALLAACVPTLPPPSPPPRAGAAAGQPKAGGTLRMGVLGDIQGLDGHLTTGLDYLRRVWDVVSVLDEKLDTVPQLAHQVDVSPDARQMTVKLRPGVRFHTGRELSAPDLVG